MGQAEAQAFWVFSMHHAQPSPYSHSPRGLNGRHRGKAFIGISKGAKRRQKRISHSPEYKRLHLFLRLGDRKIGSRATREAYPWPSLLGQLCTVALVLESEKPSHESQMQHFLAE